MMYFMNVVDFPINIGNRPPHSPPAFIPITFELAVLLGGSSAFLGSLLGPVQVPHAVPPAVRVGELPAGQRSTGSSCRSRCRTGKRPEDVMDDARLAGRGQRRGGRGVGAMTGRTIHGRAGPACCWAGLAVDRRLRRGPHQPDGRPPAAGAAPTAPATSTRTAWACGSRPPGTVPRQRVTGMPGAHHRQGGHQTTSTASPSGWTRRCCGWGRSATTSPAAPATARWATATASSARQMALRPPPSLIDFADRPVGYIFEVITKGHGLMASYAAELPVRERWAVVAYVRALQVSRHRHPGQGAGGRARPVSRRRRP